MGRGEGSGIGAPNLESLIVRTWGGGGAAWPPLHQSAQIRAGAARPAAGRGLPGPGRAARLSQNLLA